MKLSKSITAGSLALLLAGFGCKHTDEKDIDDYYNVAPAEVRPVKAGEKDIAIVVDTSGSMHDRVDGERKLVTAKRNLTDMLESIRDYQQKMQNDVKVGLFYFDDGVVKRSLAIDDFNYSRLTAAVEKLETSGGTPLGYALAYAERELDKRGSGQKSIILLTDGENSVGRDPRDVYRVIKSTNVAYNDSQTTLYVIAYDTDKRNFVKLEALGAKVYQARNASELTSVLTTIRKDILPEAPLSPGEFPIKK